MSGKRILFVDDEPLFREPIAELLRQNGFAVEEAACGTDALALAKKTRFDAVISDVLMPEMNGIEMVRRLHEKSPQTEAIVLSAFGTEATESKLSRMGVFGYLDKPVRSEDLVPMVRAATESNRLFRLGYDSNRPRLGFNKENVLVVDDEPTVRELVHEVMHREGFRVSTAEDGAQAVEMALVNDYDLIILDINMPRMNGIKAVTAIRQQDPHCFILLFSGEAEKAEIKEALAAGADKFLAKPFRADVLLDIVGKIDFKRIRNLKVKETQQERAATRRTLGWLRRAIGPLAVRRLRRRALEFALLVLLGACVGFLTLVLDSYAGRQAGGESAMEKMDRLIQAVEDDNAKDRGR